MIPTLDFLLPSLHPSTLLDVSFPLTAPGTTGEPVVRHLSIKHGEHGAVGSVKRMLSTEDGQVLVADDAFRVSSLQMPAGGSAGPPEVMKQETVAARAGNTWTGLTGIKGGAVSSLSSGLLSYHASGSSSSQSRSLPHPVTCLASSSSSATTFAAAGNGMDVSLWNVERTFAASSQGSTAVNGKRKKELEEGETWRAKNIPPNHLRLPQPIHHLALAYLPDSEDSLVSGTRLGTVRRYDVRAQRKPVHDWKVAREGGIHCVAPGSDNELFFSDRSGLLASLDLRNGRVAYTLPVSSTPQHLLPVRPEGHDSKIGLTSIASDTTFRLHATSGVERQGNKGDKEKWTRGVVGVTGGVGGQGIWRGWGEIKEDDVPGVDVPKATGDDEDEGNEEDDSDNEEQVWEGMSEVEDVGAEESDDEEDDDEEEEVSAAAPTNGKKRRTA